jgi:hypothetical protein
VLAGWLACCAGLVQAGSLPEAPACASALGALKVQEDTVIALGPAAPEAARAKALALRKVAAVQCFGANALTAPQRSAFAQPPIAVPPVRVDIGTLQPVPVRSPVAPAPPAVPAPSTVTSCDALGCGPATARACSDSGPCSSGHTARAVCRGRS